MKNSVEFTLHKTNPSRLKTTLFSVALIILVSSGLWYWKMTKAAAEGGWSGGGPIDVLAKKVVPQNVPVSLEVLGEVKAVREVVVSAEIAGRVVNFELNPGQKVEAHQLLATLDDATEQAELSAAQANQRFFKEQLDRAKDLRKIDAISKELLQQRQSEFDASNALIKQLKSRIQKKSIFAPFAGQLGLRQIDLGQYLHAGDAIISLTDMDEMYVNFNIPQHELARVKVGQALAVHSEIAGAEPIPATISAIEQQINPNTRNVTLQARVDNRQGTLQSGMYVTVNISLHDLSDALLLPTTAVMTSPFGASAVVVRNINAQHIGVAEVVPVHVSKRMGDQLVINSGLSAGDVVVTEGQLRVRPGAQLRVVSQSSDSSVAMGGLY